MKNCRKNVLKSKNGITLIALVITIIVLLILAGISISMLSGDNSILQRTTDAKEKTERQSVVEQARTDVLGYQAENRGRDLEKTQLKAVLDTYFKDVPTVEELPDGEELLSREFTTLDKYGTHTIKVSEIYNGSIYTYTPQSNGKIASEIFEANGTTEGKMHIGDYVNYPVYYDNVASYVSGTTGSNIPTDTYVGWRVLSIEGTGDSQYIRLVSAGVPLNYYNGTDATTSVKKLTTEFFSTPINSTKTQFNFYNCGFKTAHNGIAVTDISDVMELFNNTYTAKYIQGESATYTDSTLNQTYTNSNVEGQPKIQSITWEDLTAVWGSDISYGANLSSNDLLAIPCKDKTSEYAMIWLPIDHASGGMYGGGMYWHLGGSSYANRFNYTYGVRCVVSLTSNVKYLLAEESSSTDTVKTWNLE